VKDVYNEEGSQILKNGCVSGEYVNCAIKDYVESCLKYLREFLINEVSSCQVDIRIANIGH
jgi:hypothetical protein